MSDVALLTILLPAGLASLGTLTALPSLLILGALKIAFSWPVFLAVDLVLASVLLFLVVRAFPLPWWSLEVSDEGLVLSRGLSSRSLPWDSIRSLVVVPAKPVYSFGTVVRNRREPPALRIECGVRGARILLPPSEREICVGLLKDRLPGLDVLHIPAR